MDISTSLQVMIQGLESYAPSHSELAFPGAIGGLAIFLLGIRMGHYRNNKYIKKFLVEILGATTTSIYLTPFAINMFPLNSSHDLLSTLAFLIGISWSKILQEIRDRVTTAVLGKIEKEKD